MGNRRERRGRRQRRRNPSHRKIEPVRGIIDGADFISSMPDEMLHHILSFIPTDLATRTSVLSKRWRHVWCETPSLGIDGADFISSMPDEMLHHILSFIPTDLAMRTSLLSKRWRHVWCGTPCLDISEFKLKAGVINQALVSYTKLVSRITSLNLCLSLDRNAHQIDNWIEFAISRNVQELSVRIVDFRFCKTYSFPDFFYIDSFVKQLSVRLAYFYMNPRCRVSWKSLRNLSLNGCKLGDESMANILSGCPILESLGLFNCRVLERLDLTKSLSLRRLEIDREAIQPLPTDIRSGPIEIVAPHIHYLKLRIFSDKLCTLLDVSSLTEANLDIIRCRRSGGGPFQTMAVEMLAKVHSVGKLTLGTALLQSLTLAELRGVPFPTLKAQTLIVKTDPARSVIPGIQSLLHNSPKLKKLTVHTMHSDKVMRLDKSSDSQGLNPDRWCKSTYEVFPTTKEIYSILGCNDATSKLLASFMELVLRNAKTLETMVLWLGGIYFNDAQWFEELLRMVGTLSHKNNVSIVLKRTNC